MDDPRVSARLDALCAAMSALPARQALDAELSALEAIADPALADWTGFLRDGRHRISSATALLALAIAWGRASEVTRAAEARMAARPWPLPWLRRTSTPARPWIDGVIHTIDAGEAVWALAFLPDARTLLLGTQTRGILRVDASTGREIAEPLPARGRVLWLGTGEGALHAMVERDMARTVVTWDLPTFIERSVVRLAYDAPDALSASADGRWVAVTAGFTDKDTGGYYGWCTLCDTLGSQGTQRADADDRLTAVFVGGGDAPEIRLWDGAKLIEPARPEVPRREILEPPDVRTSSAAFSPDGKALLALTTTAAARVDAATGALLATSPWAGGWASLLAALPGGEALAVALGGSIYRVSPGTAAIYRLVHSGRLPARAFAAHAASPLAAAAFGRFVPVFEVAGGVADPSRPRHASGVSRIAVAARAGSTLSGAGDGSLLLWETHGGAFARELVALPSAVTALAVSDDGARAVAGCDSGEIFLLDLEGGAGHRSLGKLEQRVTSVDLHRDRALSASQAGEVDLRDLESGARIHAWSTEQRYRDQEAAFVDDGRVVVMAVSYAAGLVWFRDAASGAPIESPTTGAAAAWAVARRGDDSLVRRAGDGAVLARTYRTLRRLDGGGATAWEAPVDHGWGLFAASPDGRWIATTDEESEALVLRDGETGARVAQWDCNTLVTCLAVTPAGEIACGDAAGDVTHLRVVLPAAER